MLHTIYRTRIFLLFSLAFASVLLAACGTLEVGLESNGSSEERSALLEKSVVQTGASGISQLMLTPTPTPRPLALAFISERDVWLWTTETGEAIPLTSRGEANDSSVKISDDGELIAYSSGYELWMVRTDGTDERKLVSVEDFDAIEPVDPGVWLHHYDWTPGTHILAFNTHLRTQYGVALADDLHLVNAETLEQTTLLQPGEGGEFSYSPDGSQIAVAAAGSISLINSDGSDRRDNALTHASGRTQSGGRYHAEPVWSTDGSFLRVAILPADLQAQPPQQTTIWHIPTDGTPSTLISSIDAQLEQLVSFSPDLRHAAYLQSSHAPGAVPESSDLLISDLDSGETIVHSVPISRIGEWAPDSQHFATTTFNSADGQSIESHIGQPGGESIPIETSEEMWIFDVRWTDSQRFLMLAINTVDGSWNLLEGAIGQPSTLLASIPQSETGDMPPFDFAR